jgi:outer membrane protein
MFNYATMNYHPDPVRWISRPISPASFSGLALVLATILILAAAPFPARAQDDGDKYGFVNISQVITQSDEGLAEAAELESLSNKKQKELNERKQKLEEMADQYQKSVDSGNPETALRDRIKKMQRELERDVRQAQSDVDTSRQDRIQAIGNKVVQVIQQFAKDNDYTAIFRSDSGQVVYVAPTVDITEKIITAYNKAHPAKK